MAQLITTAVRDGDFYIVNGSKTFITGGMYSSWASTAVRTGGAGLGGISLLLIPLDAEGVSRTQLDKKQGWWASDTATLYFDNVRVPVGNLVGKENEGFKAIMGNFNLERMQLIVSMEAFARVCLEDAVKWAQERKTFGKTLSQHQVIRHKIADMKQRGLLDQTLVVWATEFGRMPFLQANGTGRDHNPKAFTCFLAGAGVKSGFSYGESDEFGFKAAVNKTSVYDFNATLLHLMGLDHERLTYYHNGLERRLTNVHGHVVKDVLA